VKHVILGINCSGFHASACLLKPDGQVQVAIAEERLTRIKQDKSFPRRAIAYCCEAAGLRITDITDVFVGWNPAPYLASPTLTTTEALRDRSQLAQLTLNELAALRTDVHGVQQTLFGFAGSTARLHYVDHHRAHLANALWQAGFGGEADFLIADGFGETTTGLIGTVRAGAVHELAANRTPHSLGLFYAAFTDFLGFRPNGDEWKVMALAARGNWRTYYEMLRPLITVDGLQYEIDLRYFEFFLFFTPHYYSPKLEALLGPALPSGAPLTQREYDIVAAVQRVTEEVLFELLTNLHAQTGQRRLVLGGGVLMNSVLNGKLRQHTPYQEIFIGGTPDDTGISVGSALHGYQQLMHGLPPNEPARHNFFGRTYTDAEMEAELHRRRLPYERPEYLVTTTAALLAAGLVMGWFQGASELGQRALGHRSIIADPTLPDMQARVNASVKHREAFRPFAPAVPEERQHEFFDLPAGETSYFMERVFPLRPAVRPHLPAVVHDDGTGRLQTVRAADNPLFHQLLLAFEQRRGVPVLLNTSFNVNGMPLVESPADALDCYFQSGLDALVLGPFLLRKEP